MGKIKELRFRLNKTYALTNKEVKKATKEAGKMGDLPDLDSVRTVEPLPTEKILSDLTKAYPKTEFLEVKGEIIDLVIQYTGKKPGGIKKSLKSYI